MQQLVHTLYHTVVVKMLNNYLNVKIYGLLTMLLKYILLQCPYMFRPDEAIFRRHLYERTSVLRTNQM
jgi:hypothetical protein